MKYVKYAIIALAPIILVVGLLFSMGGKDLPPSSFRTIDVLSGKIDTKAIKGSFPMKNKDGVRCILPVVQNEHGDLVIAERFQGVIARDFSETPIYVDRESFVVLDSPTN